MKKNLMVCMMFLIFILGGCVAHQKIMIPDEFKLHEVVIMQTDNGICIDRINTIMLGSDFRALIDENKKLRDEIKKHNEGK